MSSSTKSVFFFLIGQTEIKMPTLNHSYHMPIFFAHKGRNRTRDTEWSDYNPNRQSAANLVTKEGRARMVECFYGRGRGSFTRIRELGPMEYIYCRGRR